MLEVGLWDWLDAVLAFFFGPCPFPWVQRFLVPLTLYVVSGVLLVLALLPHLGSLIETMQVDSVGKEHLVLDLSCRKKGDHYYVVTNRSSRPI